MHDFQNLKINTMLNLYRLHHYLKHYSNHKIDFIENKFTNDMLRQIVENDPL